MNESGRNLDYTDRDFDALRARLIALARSAFPQWTDFELASFGNVLIEMFAFVGDVLAHYQDGQARETRLTTATQRRSVIALAKMLGYRLPGASAATARISFRALTPPRAGVRIPAGTVVRTQEVVDPVRFVLLDAVHIPAGSTAAVLVDAEQARWHERLVQATGEPALEVYLEQTPYLDGSLRIEQNGNSWREVESFLGSAALDRHFVVDVDERDRARVRFGDGVAGAVPAGSLRFFYKTGGGPEGNVEAERLTVLERAVIDEMGYPVRLQVHNPEPASGGTSRQSVAAAKLLIPERLRANTRSVCREDFEIHARELPAVARALMLTSNEDASIEENTGDLVVVPVGGGLPTPALKEAVLRQVTVVYPCTLTFQVRVMDPQYLRVDVRCRLFVQSGASRSRVRDQVSERLAAFFRISNPDGTPNPDVDFGYYLALRDDSGAAEVAWSDVFNVIRDTPGVRKMGDRREDLLLAGLPADVRVPLRAFPVLGDILLLDGVTGEVL